MLKHFYIAGVLGISIAFLFSPLNTSSQVSFNKKLQLGAPFKNFGQSITGIAQDAQGFIWFTSRQGLHRYDGFIQKNFRHNPLDSNTLGFNEASCIYIDEQNIIWIGSKGKGLDRFDPFLNSFTHFTRGSSSHGSISNDTVTSILKDSRGMLWIGTRNGLNMFDQASSKFTVFLTDPGNPNSISDNSIITLYEDRQKVLWIGCGSDNVEAEHGGLNRYNVRSDNFTRFVHDPSYSGSIVNSGISALYEDTRGNFWVGTAGSGVQLMDRNTGFFSSWDGNPVYPKVENMPGHKRIHDIKFICEDGEEGIWIGSSSGGITRVFPGGKNSSHFGTTFVNDLNIQRDTANGFQHYYPWRMLPSRDGLLWVITADGGMYNIKLASNRPGFYDMPGISVLCFLLEPGEEVLWIGTNNGLVRKDLKNGREKKFMFEKHTNEFPGVNTINTIKLDIQGKLLVGTSNGLIMLDTATEKTYAFRNDRNSSTSIAGNGIYALLFDGESSVWVGTDRGLDKLDLNKLEFRHYGNSHSDRRSMNNVVYDLAIDNNKEVWLGTSGGLEKLSPETGKFSKYLPNVSIWCVFIDSDERIWTTSSSGLFLYDKKLDRFNEFLNPRTKERFYDIIDILEDKKKFMWVRAPNEILRISPDKTEVRHLSLKNGVKECNPHFDRFNIMDSSGRIYMVADGGYHRFHPNDILTASTNLPIVFTGLKVNNIEVKPSPNERILKMHVSRATRINLRHNQNDFSLDFTAFDYSDDQHPTYQVKLDGYDRDWRYLGTYNRADYFNVPPGQYVLHARSINSEGFISERMIQVQISPPWWGTWWSYILYTFIFLSLLFVFVRWRTNSIRKRNTALEKKVVLRTQQFQSEKEKLELTLEELKATQEQLILKEKMASLGEMTNGIAHELQNPLNFVNNFSEVNKELVEELKVGMNEGDSQLVQEILDDLGSNTQRICFHGKRADQIVRSMFQFTQGANSKKMPIDIVALADEHMWRTFDTFKKRDGSFNACVNMDFRTELGQHFLVPSDLGRVLMSLYDNAFYSVHEKKTRLASECPIQHFEPVVTVTAKEEGGNLIISIADNGNGIPRDLRSKIFQPFFTTKPTGSGTGLGLSLSYDIVKAHGGEIRVESQEGVGASFFVVIPVSNSVVKLEVDD